MAFSMISLLGIFLLAILLLVFGLGFSLRSQQKNLDSVKQELGGKRMIKTVYTYLILFATLMMTIGGSVASFMAVADLVSPPGYYMTYEEYKRGWAGPKESIDPKQPVPQTEVRSEEQIRNDYEILVKEEGNRARDRALNSLIKSFGWIVIPLPVFLYYQRRLRQE